MHGTGRELGDYTLHTCAFDLLGRTCTVYHGRPSEGQVAAQFVLP
jgi:hypothetical protein